MALGSTCAFNPIGFCFGSILPQPQEWPKLFGRLVLHVGRQGACKLASGWGQFSGKTPSYPFLNSTRLSKSACWLLLTDYQQIFYHFSTWAFFVRPSPSRLPKPRTWLAFTKKIRLWWNEEFMVWEDSWRVPKNCWSFGRNRTSDSCEAHSRGAGQLLQRNMQRCSKLLELKL